MDEAAVAVVGAARRLYPLTAAQRLAADVMLAERLQRCRPLSLPASDVVLSLYPDQVVGRGDQRPSAIRRTLDAARAAVGSSPVLHLLPPYVSDPTDRFSIRDDTSIDPQLGSWSDIQAARPIMLDMVVTQLSVESKLFKRAKRGHASAASKFFNVPESFDLSRMNRPPTFVHLSIGRSVLQIWSTYGAGQVDLDYTNPETAALAIRRLAKIVSSCDWVRLDGIAYAWKESGTDCSNLLRTHDLCELLCAFIKALTRGRCGTLAECDSYTDSRAYECDHLDAVLNYEFPPALVAACLLGEIRPAIDAINHSALTYSSRNTQSFNVGMTHDGITLRPWAPSLADPMRANLNCYIGRSGLRLSERIRAGRKVPYELHNTWYDLAFTRTHNVERAQRLNETVHSVLLASAGVVYTYLPGALGAQSAGGIGRASVRGPLDMRTLPSSRLGAMLSARRIQGLGQTGSLVAEATSEGLLCVRQSVANGTVYCVHNFTDEGRPFTIARAGLNLITGSWAGPTFHLEPFDFIWVLSI